MARVTPVLWTQKKNKKGHCPIYLRIEANDRRRYVSLRTRIHESHWNDNKRRVRKTHPQHEAINNLIAQRVAEAEGEILKLRTDRERITVETLKDSLTPETAEASGDFFVFADDVIQDFERRGSIYTHKRYKSVCKKFRAFTGEPLPFDKITPRLLRNYETHLIEHYKNNRSTIAANFNGLRSILYKAIREGKFPQADNPFFHCVRLSKPRSNANSLTGGASPRKQRHVWRCSRSLRNGTTHGGVTRRSGMPPRWNTNSSTMLSNPQVLNCPLYRGNSSCLSRSIMGIIAPPR